MQNSHVGIAGIGAVTGYGWGREQLWSGLVSGESAVREHSGYGEALGDRAWVARVADEGSQGDGPSRFSQAMRFAAREAVEDAYLHGWVPGPTVGLIHAVVLGEVDLWRDFYLQHNGERSVRDYLALLPSTPMSTLMQEFGFHGPAMNVSAMCASGNAAMLTAKAWIDSGIATDVVIVATDLSCTPENVRHFRDLGVAITDATPEDACRPFQEGSRGFLMGEASVGYVMSGSARDPYARMLGGMMSHDAHHATSIAPDLRQVRRCFDEALGNAGVGAGDVAYLNAHGPGTRQCDRAESTMLDELLVQAEVYSVKPLAGHCQAAASAVETAAAALAYERGIVPAPRQQAPGHARLLDGVVDLRRGPTVKSSLGMGGHNSVIVLDAP
jgi:3-oxoacyl-[acyl-carrier-protein] synthase II